MWKHGLAPNLRNRIACYDKGLDGKKRVQFEEEVDRWVKEGILRV